MKTIVTHLSPDLDAISSIWLIKRFLPGWERAAVKFVPAGNTLDNQLVDSHVDIIHVDTGLGKFDHHQTNADTCAAQKIFQYLKTKPHFKKNLAALERMINIINDTDHFRDVFLPDADSDIYNFSLDYILDGLRIHFQDDRQLVTVGELICDGVYQSFINKVSAEVEIQNGFVFQTRWGKTLALESNNEETARLAQKKDFAMVIRKSPKKGHLRIKLSPKVTKIDLASLYDTLKKRDPKATWFFHASGKMILNGSSKNPDVVSTKLNLSQILEIVKN